MSCKVCKQKNLKFRLWQTSLNKYVNFCTKDCIKTYLKKKYKKALHKRAIGIAFESMETYEVNNG